MRGERRITFRSPPAREPELLRLIRENARQVEERMEELWRQASRREGDHDATS